MANIANISKPDFAVISGSLDGRAVTFAVNAYNGKVYGGAGISSSFVSYSYAYGYITGGPDAPADRELFTDEFLKGVSTDVSGGLIIVGGGLTHSGGSTAVTVGLYSHGAGITTTNSSYLFQIPVYEAVTKFREILQKAQWELEDLERKFWPSNLIPDPRNLPLPDDFSGVKSGGDESIASEKSVLYSGEGSYKDAQSVAASIWQYHFEIGLGTNPAFIAEPIPGYELEINPNGVPWNVNAAGIPTPADVAKYETQLKVIEYADNRTIEDLQSLGMA